ncbi:helix-turn-helix domain-containing protein [Bacillus zhangzhouensis]|uniref:helix-turn-helix domain-containing protein n=1 Tax=Bacillus zhangzhouensis TaxID=1178540 RepID=UPI003D1A1A2A
MNKELKLSYKPLRHTLVEKEKNLSYIRNNTKISSATLAKINKDEPISLTSVIRICELLDCDLNDVVEILRVKG